MIDRVASEGGGTADSAVGACAAVLLREQLSRRSPPPEALSRVAAAATSFLSAAAHRADAYGALGWRQLEALCASLGAAQQGAAPRRLLRPSTAPAGLAPPPSPRAAALLPPPPAAAASASSEEGDEEAGGEASEERLPDNLLAWRWRPFPRLAPPVASLASVPGCSLALCRWVGDATPPPAEGAAAEARTAQRHAQEVADDRARRAAGGSGGGGGGRGGEGGGGGGGWFGTEPHQGGGAHGRDAAPAGHGLSLPSSRGNSSVAGGDGDRRGHAASPPARLARASLSGGVSDALPPLPGPPPVRLTPEDAAAVIQIVSAGRPPSFVAAAQQHATHAAFSTVSSGGPTQLIPRTLVGGTFGGTGLSGFTSSLRAGLPRRVSTPGGLLAEAQAQAQARRSVVVGSGCGGGGNSGGGGAPHVAGESWGAASAASCGQQPSPPSLPDTAGALLVRMVAEQHVACPDAALPATAAIIGRMLQHKRPTSRAAAFDLILNLAVYAPPLVAHSAAASASLPPLLRALCRGALLRLAAQGEPSDGVWCSACSVLLLLTCVGGIPSLQRMRDAAPLPGLKAMAEAAARGGWAPELRSVLLRCAAVLLYDDGSAPQPPPPPPAPAAAASPRGAATAAAAASPSMQQQQQQPQQPQQPRLVPGRVWQLGGAAWLALQLAAAPGDRARLALLTPLLDLATTLPPDDGDEADEWAADCGAAEAAASAAAAVLSSPQPALLAAAVAAAGGACALACAAAAGTPGWAGAAAEVLATAWPPLPPSSSSSLQQQQQQQLLAASSPSTPPPSPGAPPPPPSPLPPPLPCLLLRPSPSDLGCSPGCVPRSLAVLEALFARVAALSRPLRPALAASLAPLSRVPRAPADSYPPSSAAATPPHTAPPTRTSSLAHDGNDGGAQTGPASPQAAPDDAPPRSPQPPPAAPLLILPTEEDAAAAAEAEAAGEGAVCALRCLLRDGASPREAADASAWLVAACLSSSSSPASGWADGGGGGSGHLAQPGARGGGGSPPEPRSLLPHPASQLAKLLGLSPPAAFAAAATGGVLSHPYNQYVAGAASPLPPPLPPHPIYHTSPLAAPSTAQLLLSTAVAHTGAPRRAAAAASAARSTVEDCCERVAASASSSLASHAAAHAAQAAAAAGGSAASSPSGGVQSHAHPLPPGASYARDASSALASLLSACHLLLASLGSGDAPSSHHHHPPLPPSDDPSPDARPLSDSDAAFATASWACPCAALLSGLWAPHPGVLRRCSASAPLALFKALSMGASASPQSSLSSPAPSGFPVECASGVGAGFCGSAAADARCAMLKLVLSKASAEGDETVDAIGGEGFVRPLLGDADPRIALSAARFLLARLAKAAPGAYRAGLRRLLLRAQAEDDERLMDNAFFRLQSLSGA